MENEFSFRTRSAKIEEISGQECSVLIIGGGITGAGIASVLAENGIDAVLVEKGDFASGTSSGSSKLIHGGLRYLANGEIGEVRDLLKERDFLLKHTDIVKPLNFHIILDDYSWKKYVLRFGLFLYNILGGRFSIPGFRKNNGTYPEGVRGYFEYMDAYTDDSSLVVYNIVSAARKGAVCLNYCEAREFTMENGNHTVKVTDSINGKDFLLRPGVIVNAAGPWAGGLMGKLGNSADKPFRLSKGVHIVLPSSVIETESAIAFRSHIDKRQMFIIPRGEVVHAGTTDTFVDSPEDLEITDADISYIIESVSQLFPNVQRSDVVTAFSGIRPLFGSGDDPGKVTRGFDILVNGRVVNVLGGKITNYRSASRKVALKVAELLGREISVAGLPLISYERPRDGNTIRHEIFHECPMTLEDIMRRREAYTIYRKDSGKSVEQSVKDEMIRAGMVSR